MIAPLLVLALAPQEADPWFRLQSIRSAETTELLVSAEKSAAPAAEAITRLARLMRWELMPMSAAVRQRLAPVSVDLSFARRKPRDVARWIALAASVEASFHPAGRTVQLRLREPAALSKAELRTRAEAAFREVLDDSAAPAAARLDAMLGLGRLHADAGADAAAIGWFLQVAERDTTQRRTAAAWLALARVYDRRARQSGRDRDSIAGDRLHAQRYARRLLDHENLDVRAAALLLLGRSLHASERTTEALTILATRAPAVRTTPMYLDLRVLEARCLWQDGQAERALVRLDELARDARTWQKGQWRDYHFCRGMAALRVRGRREDAIRSLEWFLGSESVRRHGTARQRTALLALGECYLASRRYVDAQAVVERLLQRPAPADEGARVLEARVRVALGFPEAARRRLRLAVAGREASWHLAKEYLATLEHEPVPRVGATLAEMFARARRHERAAVAAKGATVDRQRELAFDLYKRIERQDVIRGEDGKPRPGPWGVAARSAIAMLRWTHTKGSWRAPPVAEPPK